MLLVLIQSIFHLDSKFFLKHVSDNIIHVLKVLYRINSELQHSKRACDLAQSVLLPSPQPESIPNRLILLLGLLTLHLPDSSSSYIKVHFLISKYFLTHIVTKSVPN